MMLDLAASDFHRISHTRAILIVSLVLTNYSWQFNPPLDAAATHDWHGKYFSLSVY